MSAPITAWTPVANLRPGDVLASLRAAGPRDHAPTEVPGAVAIVANVAPRNAATTTVTYLLFTRSGRYFSARTDWRNTANLARLNIRDEDLTNLANLADDGTANAAHAANPDLEV